MPWNQVFPLGTSQVSQAPTLFQQNWAFINTNLNMDHYFNAVNPNNEGHHKFVQMLDQGGDPALAAGMSAVEYSKATGNVNMEQPYWRNAVGIRQIPTVITGTVAVAVGTTQNMFSFVGLPRSMGLISVQDPTGASNNTVAFYFRDTVNNIVVTNISNGGNILALAGVLLNTITIQTNYNGNAFFQIYTMPY